MYTREQAETMRADAWRPKLQAALRWRRKIPNMDSGVYILLKRAKVLYVGQARCVIRRLMDHVYKRIDFDEYVVLPVERSRLLEVERIVITLLDPPLNRCGGDRVDGALRKLKPVKIPKC